MRIAGVFAWRCIVMREELEGCFELQMEMTARDDEGCNFYRTLDRLGFVNGLRCDYLVVIWSRMNCCQRDASIHWQDVG